MKLIHNITIALLATIGSASAAFADADSAENFVIKTANVSYADLDLTTPTDAAALLERIEKTAMKVCRRLDGGSPMDRLLATQECFKASYSNGVTAINARKNVDIEAVAARATTSRDVVAAD